MGTDRLLVIHHDQLGYVDERVESKAPLELIERAERAGVRRKILTRGEGGFHAHLSEFPPGYLVPAHSHDHDELIIVVEGDLTFLDDGPTLRPLDSAVVRAGQRYGFVAGTDGVKFVNTRSQPTTIQVETTGTPTS